MDLLLALAAASGAAVALCNDPDADRLGAAIPTPEGGWRRLQGDEIGWLLADHILRHTTGDDRLVITTLVSSSLLARMAAAVRGPICRDVHRVQMDRAHRLVATRVALRVRLRAGAWLPRVWATTRQGRDHRSCTDRRSRSARHSRGRDAAGSSRRDHRAVRPACDGRPVGEDAAGGRHRCGRTDARDSSHRGRRSHGDGGRVVRRGRSAAFAARDPNCACSFAPAAPSRRSSSTAKASTWTQPLTSTRSPTLL